MKHIVEVMKWKRTAKKKAEKKLLEGISEGKYNSPKGCVDSWCETERVFE